MIDIVFQKINEDAILPHKEHENDAGYDVFSTDSWTLEPGNRKLFKLGLLWSPNLTGNEDFKLEIQVRSKSGRAFKEGLAVLNSPGTIDQNYKDEIGVILINHSNTNIEIKKGQKIAQFVFNMIPRVKIAAGIINFNKTPDRGGGWGSTGL